MPYYIRKDTEDCKGRWATVDKDGKTISCHDTKEQAIKHMVAASIGSGEDAAGDWEHRNRKGHL